MQNTSNPVNDATQSSQELGEELLQNLFEEDDKPAPNTFAPTWSSDAPRGGRTVMARALKDSAAVPLFLAQTFVQSLRDVGYDSTTSALCEHVDNAIGANATEVRVFFRQAGKKGNLSTDILVQDNGIGMAPNVLKVATSFGGSMAFNNRSGIGRFGMGMKTAGLSMAPAIEIISWQEQGSYYRMILDTEAIGRDKANLIALDDPDFLSTLDTDIAGFFANPMSFPKDATEQHLLAPYGVRIEDALGKSGTIVYMPECDRLSSALAKTLVEDATKTFAHVYRRTASYDLAPTIELRIDRLLDRIANGDGDIVEDAQAIKRGIATARRRERNRARLVRLHVIAPAANDDILAIDRDHDSQYHARDALRQIMTLTSDRDYTMIFHLAMGYNGPEVARLIGLSENACRKRVSRLRAEFDHLKAA